MNENCTQETQVFILSNQLNQRIEKLRLYQKVHCKFKSLFPLKLQQHCLGKIHFQVPSRETYLLQLNLYYCDLLVLLCVVLFITQEYQYRSWILTSVYVENKKFYRKISTELCRKLRIKYHCIMFSQVYYSKVFLQIELCCSIIVASRLTVEVLRK